MLRKSPVFTAVAVLSLALGIGATTAIFSFVDAIFLRPLPVPKPERLVVMKWRMEGRFPSTITSGLANGTGIPTNAASGNPSFPYPALDLFRADTEILDSVFGYYSADGLNVTIGQQTEAVPVQFVTGTFFPGLKVSSAAGRLLEEQDNHPGRTPVAALSYAFAHRHYADIGEAVGDEILVNNEPFTVSGVTAPEFFGADPARIPDIYLPVRSSALLSSQLASATTLKGDAQFQSDGFYWMALMGRLREGISLQMARAALGPQFAVYAEATYSGETVGNPPELLLLDGSRGMDGLQLKYATQFYVLLAMVIILLMLACVNVATLLLGRAISREQEIATRVSLGAGGWRVARQLLTESLLLAIVGGIAGVGIAYFGIQFLTALLADGARTSPCTPN